MPTYVYECSSCSRVFEAEQRITEDPLDTCECGAKGTVKRIIQPIAVMFKGSGFHINDYKGSGGSAPTSSPSEPSAPATDTPAAASTDAPSTPSSGE